MLIVDCLRPKLEFESLGPRVIGVPWEKSEI